VHVQIIMWQQVDSTDWTQRSKSTVTSMRTVTFWPSVTAVKM